MIKEILDIHIISFVTYSLLLEFGVFTVLSPDFNDQSLRTSACLRVQQRPQENVSDC